MRLIFLLAGLAVLGPGPVSRAQTPSVASVSAVNARIEGLAKTARRGLYPRGFSGEQPYWTLLGVDGGRRSGLISEDGAIELAKGDVSVEPFVFEDGKLVTWADVAVSQSLKEGYLPIPGVTWRRLGWELRVTAFAAGEAKSPRLIARYVLRNLGGRPETLTLALAVRPFQVNGPEQFLNSQGGFSPIRDLAWNGAAVVVNGRARVFPSRPPDRLAPWPARGGVLGDPAGLASGALSWRITLPSRGSAIVGWVAPLAEGAPRPPPPTPASIDRDEAAITAGWRERLNRVAFTVPPAGRAATDTLRTSLAWMLTSRNGPMLRPGTRSYDRSWIRDGAMISEALLRLGQGDVAADYLRWYAPFQFAGGKIPCCVDGRGADPTPENDSAGEFVHLAAEVWRYGGDRALLRETWPRVLAAADYMDRLRRSERTAANQAADRRMLYGLMPPSISHEGYSSKPAYSYWDDFWALTGYKDAVLLAGAVGDEAARARLVASRDEFHADLLASVRASASAHGIGFIPGAADLGDYDATSTTIALVPGGEGEALPADLLAATFERYWREFTARRDVDRTWDAYTPYELRVIGSFVRLVRRDRADALLDFFLKDRRPVAWNGWAEVVGREARKQRFIGDMPHAWVASDYARSVLDMFAYECERDRALVLGAGLPPDWFDGAGVGVAELRTPWGPLTWSAKSRDGKVVLKVAGAHPPGGFVFPWPFAGPPGAARLNGRPLAWSDGALRFAGPAEVIIDRR